jgi:hypothetical protein
MIPVVNGILSLELTLDLSLSTLASLAAIALVTGIVSGLYPALYLSSLRPVSVLRREAPGIPLLGRGEGGSGYRTRGTALRRLLVVVQFTLSVVFVLCVVIIFKQVVYVKNLDLGFNKDRVLVFDLPRELVLRATTVKNELLEHPNIEAVTFSRYGLFGWHTSFGIGWEGQLPGQLFDVGFNRVDHDYLDAFEMEMVEGRFFSPEVPSDASTAFVVNEAVVKAMGITDPVGRRIVAAPHSSMEMRGTIIGVIRNYHTESAHTEVRPFMLAMTGRGNVMFARLGSGRIGETVQFIKDKVKEIHPDARVWSHFVDDEVTRMYGVEILTGTVTVFIAALAILISCLGLFGLTAFTAQQRTKEIGIRKVLGASVASIVAMFVREILLLVAVAGIIGGPIAYLVMSRWLEGFAFRAPIGPWPFGSVVGGLVAIALATVGLQAMRAALANPVDAIRYE